MFELKYAFTDRDLRAENKRATLFYFLLYGIVAVVGLAVGIVAVVLDSSKSIFVIGIIILVFSGLLMCVALFMLIAPKTLMSGAIAPSDDELSVAVDKHGITANGENIAEFADITKIKDRKTFIVAHLGKDKIFILKDAITSGQTIAELRAYMTERQGKLLIVPPEQNDTLDVERNEEQNM